MATESCKEEYTSLDTVNIVFTFIFLVEALIIMIGTGLIEKKKSYFRVGWNYVDCLIIVMGILSIIPTLRKEKAVKILNFIRTIKVSYKGLAHFDLPTAV